MQRAKRIAVRGWQRFALNVATFGYYPFNDVSIGKVCIGTITMALPGAAFSLMLPGVSFAMTTTGATVSLALPGADTALTTPSATIDMEDCD